MPQGSAPVLLVRVTDVLDRSLAGKKAADELRASFVDAKKRRDAIVDPADGARFEAETARAIEGEREQRRAELLVKARAAAEAIRKKRGALVVLDAGAALAAAADLDVTDELISALDRAG
ncbi:MAG: hypothetical protein HYS27_13920 [Deltaproteobacteria bacterium]|nr:hypothetical protein [Deltaproteobacteria bacterium]